LAKVRTGFDKVIQMARTILQEELAKVRTGFDKVIQMARTILQEELAQVRTGFDKVILYYLIKTSPDFRQFLL
jgi:hypothetical protein